MKYIWDMSWSYMLSIFCGSILFCVFLIHKYNRHLLIYFLIFNIFLGIGFIKADITNYSSSIIFEEKKEYVFTGYIVTEPENRESSKRIIFQPDTVDGLSVQTHEKIIIITSLSAPFGYGDYISVVGTLQRPENFQSDKGIEFDYIHFLAKDHVYYQSYRPHITLIKKSDSLFSVLFKFKKQFIEAVNKNITSPHAELVGGILLGLKSSLGEQLELDFRRVGLIHIVVLSGYNITIISVAILAVLFFLPLTLRLLTGLIAICIFAILVGSGATVIRASIMSTIAIFGQIFHRTYDVNRALFIAGIIMIFLNPYILIYDPSFQLSFLATYGLINFSEKVKSWFQFLPEKFGLKEIVVSTVATQIAVFPLLSKMIGEISIISLLVNVITLPTIPMAMLLGFLIGLFGLTPFTILTSIISFLAYLNLGYVIKITETFSQLPFATISLPKINWFEIVLLYGLIIILFNCRPVQISKKIFNVLGFSTWIIIRYKRMFPHINSQHRS